LSITENLLRVAGTISTAVVFAIERANIDLLVFLLIVAALLLLDRSSIARTVGYSFAFLAGVIKYYPFVLFGLLARERTRVGIPVAVAALVGLWLFVHYYGAQIREGLPYVPHFLPFSAVFGAINLPIGLFLTLRASIGSQGAVLAAATITTLTIGVLVGLMIYLWRRGEVIAALDRIDEPRRLALLAGALLTTGCFFVAQNVGYRGIFLLFLLPGLSALSRDSQAAPTARAAGFATIAIVVLMWIEALRLWIHLAVTGHYPPPEFGSVLVLDQPLDVVAWGVREVAWWMLIAFLLLILFGALIARPLSRGRVVLASLRSRA
jgi:hypothetical protein